MYNEEPSKGEKGRKNWKEIVSPAKVVDAGNLGRGISEIKKHVESKERHLIRKIHRGRFSNTLKKKIGYQKEGTQGRWGRKNPKIKKKGGFSMWEEGSGTG